MAHSKIEEFARKRNAAIEYGSFSNVIVCETKVYKIWEEDKAFEDFLRIKNQLNPLFTMQTSRIKKLSIGDRKLKVIVSEKLTPVKYGTKNYAVLDLIETYSTDFYKYPVRNTSLIEHFSNVMRDDPHSESYFKFLDKNKSFMETLQSCYEHCINLGYEPDFSTYNIMQRGKNLVIVDPFFDCDTNSFNSNLNTQLC